MSSCGTGELLVLGFVLLVVLSASRMGALGNALGKFVYSFKKASKGEDFIEVQSKSSLKSRSAAEDAEFIDPKKRS